MLTAPFTAAASQDTGTTFAIPEYDLGLSLDTNVEWAFRGDVAHATSEGARDGISFPLTLATRTGKDNIPDYDAFFAHDGTNVFTDPSFPGVSPLVYTWGEHEGGSGGGNERLQRRLRRQRRRAASLNVV